MQQSNHSPWNIIIIMQQSNHSPWNMQQSNLLRHSHGNPENLKVTVIIGLTY